MAKKYKVTCNDQFLGHYYGTTPWKAINKAVQSNLVYHPWIDGHEFDCEYIATKGGCTEDYKYTGKVEVA